MSEHTPLPENHCLDCCCARAWKSLGVTKYTGKAIYEHIDKLIAENKRLKTALQELLVAVCYKTPTVDFGTDKEPNPCYEARVPVQFVHDAHQALNESE